MRRCGLFCFMLVLCASASSPPGSAAAEVVFRARFPHDIETLDWNQASLAINSWAIKNLMDGLFENDEQSRFRPRLARSHRISPDGKSIRIELRSGVRWSDGRPLLAQDFVDSWRRLLDPRQAYPYAALLFDLVGAEEFHAGRVKDPSRIGAAALGPLSLELRLKKRSPFFLYMLTMWPTFPIRADLIAAHGERWTDPEKLVVLGPYKLARREAGKTVVLVRNEAYWDTKPGVERVEMPVIADEREAIAAMKVGKLDYLYTSEVKQADRILGSTVSHRSFEAYRTTYLGFARGAQGPLASAHLRRAVAMALDKKALLAAFEARLSPADSFVPPRLLRLKRTTVPPPSVAAAKALLAEAGMDPRRIGPLRLIGQRGDRSAEILQLVAEQLKERLGLETEVRLLEQTPFQDALGVGAGSAFLLNWGADYSDPYTFLSLFLSDSGTNRIRFRDARYDELVKGAALISDAAARAPAYQEALSLLQAREAAVIPLFYNRYDYFLGPRVRKFAVSPMGDVYFRDVELR